MLSAAVRLAIGQLELDVDLTVASGETLVLLGPNGAGKTTVLRAVAGLLPITEGEIRVDDEVWDCPALGTWVEPHRRKVGYVFQDYLLFPHLSALDNVAYGLRRQGMGSTAAREVAVEWLGRVGLSAHKASRPRELSGGQAQRVALARALAVDPEVLLLDEPLAALDVVTRMDIRAQLKQHLDDFAGPTVLVTHDPDDAHMLGDTVVVLEHGRPTGRGALDGLLAAPATPYLEVLAAARRGDAGTVNG